MTYAALIQPQRLSYFPRLKENLTGHKFQDDSEVRAGEIRHKNAEQIYLPPE